MKNESKNQEKKRETVKREEEIRGKREITRTLVFVGVVVRFVKVGVVHGIVVVGGVVGALLGRHCFSLFAPKILDDDRIQRQALRTP